MLRTRCARALVAICLAAAACTESVGDLEEGVECTVNVAYEFGLDRWAKVKLVSEITAQPSLYRVRR
jgi:hypothetical protein